MVSPQVVPWGAGLYFTTHHPTLGAPAMGCLVGDNAASQARTLPLLPGQGGGPRLAEGRKAPS